MEGERREGKGERLGLTAYDLELAADDLRLTAWSLRLTANRFPSIEKNENSIASCEQNYFRNAYI